MFSLITLLSLPRGVKQSPLKAGVPGRSGQGSRFAVSFICTVKQATLPGNQNTDGMGDGRAEGELLLSRGRTKGKWQETICSGT